MFDDDKEMAEMADAALGIVKAMLVKVANDDEILDAISGMYLGLWHRFQRGGMSREEATQVVSHMQMPHASSK